MTLSTATIVVPLQSPSYMTITHPRTRAAWAADFAGIMLRRVFELSRTHDSHNHNDADRKARNFFLLAAWVREASYSANETVTIAQDNTLTDPDPGSDIKWGMARSDDARTISVSPALMAVLTSPYANR